MVNKVNNKLINEKKETKDQLNFGPKSMGLIVAMSRFVESLKVWQTTLHQFFLNVSSET